MRVNVMDNEKLIAARELLRSVTPLKTDCGLRCGGACCQPEGDQRGMLLFPGEDELYENCDFAHVEPLSFLGLEGAKMLVCDGHCPRDERPLACRIFPLAPALREGKFRVQIDRRAFAVCPLALSGARGFDRAFVSACSRAFALLSEDEKSLKYLNAWSALMDELKRGL